MDLHGGSDEGSRGMSNIKSSIKINIQTDLEILFLTIVHKTSTSTKIQDFNP